MTPSLQRRRRRAALLRSSNRSGQRQTRLGDTQRKRRLEFDTSWAAKLQPESRWRSCGLPKHWTVCRNWRRRCAKEMSVGRGVRELTRVATRATERAWLEASRGRTVREVEKQVSGHRPGDSPGDAKDWRAERHVLRFQVSGEVLASFREARAKLRRDAGGPLDDDATLLLMARHVLGGPTDDGRASYQIALRVCEACERATQTGLGEALRVSAEVAEMASCDAQQFKGMRAQSRSRRQDSTKNRAASIGGGGDEAHVGGGRHRPARSRP
jgi:hypothetical protein